eukprot:TRINITY_DN5515_c0_g1_i1.p1 TRINITY_DN5515_c0_g1~~TRINITY_DN5515_c0_g1_i1.p1  ORF type:complete len:408 (+),score=140.18 TRINITY_DN5515_c0_g1_i1:97-1320(+)
MHAMDRHGRGGYGSQLVGGVWVDHSRPQQSPLPSTPPARSGSSLLKHTPPYSRNGVVTPRTATTTTHDWNHRKREPSPGLQLRTPSTGQRGASLTPTSTPYSYGYDRGGAMNTTPVAPPRLEDLAGRAAEKPYAANVRGSTSPRTTLPYSSMLYAKGKTDYQERQAFYPTMAGEYTNTSQKAAPTAAGPTLLPPQRAEHHGKYTVVFDLDETIVYARAHPIKVRPGAQQLLESLKGRAEVVLWTAGDAVYARNALRYADPSGTVEHVVSRDARWYKGDRNEKNLLQLGRELDKTVIIENTSDCIVRNVDNAILVPDYNGVAELGDVLGKVRAVLQEMIASQRRVQDFLGEQHDSGVLSKVKVPCTVHPVITALSVTGYPPTTSYPVDGRDRYAATQPASYTKPHFRY